ncbi:MAG: hypothetical protein MI923_27655 [Phycisphaerales bacterium]|nr:hypothetical protein [Phycisphaerales bacterium]
MCHSALKRLKKTEISRKSSRGRECISLHPPASQRWVPSGFTPIFAACFALV